MSINCLKVTKASKSTDGLVTLSILAGSMVEAGAWVVLVGACVAAVRYWREIGEGVREFKGLLRAIDDLWAGPG